MFYPELLKVINKYSESKEFIEEFDKWLFFLPRTYFENITTDLVSRKFNIDYNYTKKILEECCELEVLQKQYSIQCPKCEHTILISNENDLYDNLCNLNICYSCENEIEVGNEDIYIIYSLKFKPDVSEEEINDFSLKNDENNDILKNDEYIQLNNVLFAPTDEEYEKLIKLYEDAFKLNATQNMTQKGDALTELILYLFGLVKIINTEKKIHTSTNEIDCVVRSKISYLVPQYMIDLGELWIIECKNEESVPGNTYFHKILGIMSKTGVKFGIVVSKKKPSGPCFQIAREELLLSKFTNKVISIEKDDIEKIIYKKQNLLDIIESKIYDLMLNTKKPLIETSLF